MRNWFVRYENEGECLAIVTAKTEKGAYTKFRNQVGMYYIYSIIEKK